MPGRAFPIIGWSDVTPGLPQERTDIMTTFGSLRLLGALALAASLAAPLAPASAANWQNGGPGPRGHDWGHGGGWHGGGGGGGWNGGGCCYRGYNNGGAVAGGLLLGFG